VSGVQSRTAQTYLISSIPSLAQNSGVFWLTANDKEEEIIFQLLTYWLPGATILQGSLELTPDQLMIFDSGKPFILVTSAEHTIRTIPHPDELAASVLHLELNQRISPSDVAQECVKRGYEWNTNADKPGAFARRGSIVDVFIVGTNVPIRIECDEQRIASIMPFDQLSKKRKEPLETLDVIPAKLHASHRANLWAYLARAKNPVVIMESPDELEERVSDWEKIQKHVTEFRRVVLETFRTRQRSVLLSYRRAPLYYNRLKTLADDIKKYAKEVMQVIVATKKRAELTKLFHEYRVKTDILWLENPPPVVNGFINEKEHILFLSDQEIFGYTDIDYSLPRRVETAFITELRPGDYVVHIDHGVARFKGMTRNVVEDISREYFVLEYAENDKLYVPVETAEKVNKYIGLAHPKLHRLSGGQWYQITRKIKEEAKLLAQDLLKLYARRNTSAGKKLGTKTQEETGLEQSFPFEETPDQLRAISEVEKDLMSDTPMDRLICGDVGFGKTEVAIRAAFKAVMNGMQVALLSPTTILTQQHFDTFRERLKQFNIPVAILSRFASDHDEQQTIIGLKTGDVKIVIGTHRLLSPDIVFKNLGLIIIDEEQRFGVQHKERLKSLRTEAHILTLTATPIPRTLNIALSGIRDVSIIETPPEGRLPIETIIERHDTNIIIKAIRAELGRKGQVYYLYNNVETIEFAAQEINKLIPEAKIGIAHGKLSEKQLARTMHDFDTGKTNILVCSTIIENGLDIPNVNTLIVEQTTKFGLAQLYQLRGRIGRGYRQAYAYFLYDRKKLTGMAKQRLQALLEAKELGSGFQLALRDLEIRGTGNILGKEQHGKVSAIGLAMYTRLLAQAVQELKTGKVQNIRDVSVDLPVEIGIPKTFITAESERLIVYQKLANLGTPDELHAFAKRITYKQKVPLPLKNLFDVLEIKLLSQKTDITTIDTVTIPGEAGVKRKRIVISFAHHLDPKKLGPLLEKNGHWQFTQNQIKIDLEHLGENWLEELKKAIQLWHLGTPAQEETAPQSAKT
jgi:transcription-repair coupling factor (superfamily II helicase)